MELCRICFQKVTDGIPVPGLRGATAIIHDECLANIILQLAEDPQKEGLLRYLVEWEEKHAPHDWSKDVSGESTDISWEWTDVGIPATKIRSLVNTGVVSIVLSTNSSTYYSLVGREVIKNVLYVVHQTGERTEEAIEGIPDDLFDVIIGYEDVKENMFQTLKGGHRVHYLMIGPPATAKSLFLWQIGRIDGSYLTTGSRVSGPGLTEIFFNHRPKALLLDELDKIPHEALSTLLSVMETGEVIETKYKRERRAKVDTIVFAAANTDRNIPSELMSRFDAQLYFRSYTSGEFVAICERYLTRYEGIPEEIASYIGKLVWQKLDRDVRRARGAARMLKEPSFKEVDRVISFLGKYKKVD